MSETPQSLGGQARAKALSPEERQAIARKAALARHTRTELAGRLPRAISQGTLRIGDVVIDVYVLEDRRRVIHKRGMARALGLKSAGGNAFMKTISRKGLGSAVSAELRDKISKPLEFFPLNGDPAHGYRAEVFIEVCDAIIEAGKQNKLAPSQLFLAMQAEFIVRSAAKIGIIGLIDEATGFIADKRREEYRELWEEFIREEFRAWESEFPDRFFDCIYRLYGLKRKDPRSFKHPRFFSKFIRKYIYTPLANSNGAILAELDAKNPVVYANGGRRYKMFQFLSDEIGMPALKAHLWQVVGIAAAAPDKGTFERAFYRAFPEAAPFGVQGDLFDHAEFDG
jgi:hypothetical protein